MKYDILDKILIALKWVFFGAVPLALFIYKYTIIGTAVGGTKFIVGCSAYLFGLIIYIVIKKVLFREFLKKLDGKLINFESQMEIETDPVKITNLEKAYGRTKTILDCFRVIPTILIVGLVLVICKALENDLITLFTMLSWCAISYVLGFVCMLILNARTKAKNH